MNKIVVDVCSECGALAGTSAHGHPDAPGWKWEKATFRRIDPSRRSGLRTVRQVVDLELQKHASVLGVVDPKAIAVVLIALDANDLLGRVPDGLSAIEWRERVLDAQARAIIAAVAGAAS